MDIADTQSNRPAFDIDQLIADCRAARSETEPRRAIKEVLDRALAHPGDVTTALSASRAQVTPLYVSDELSVLNAVWAPGMSFRPHNHLMWAVIGIYGGQENNTFYRRTNAGIVASGSTQLRARDVAVLGDDTIHAVTNPLRQFTGAIHVYGGDVTRRPGRSEWDEITLDEVAFDFERVRRYFDEHNAASSAGD